MLTTVFKVHRFIAGGFGLSLLFAPDAVNEAMVPGRIMPTVERLTLQSWACFMIGVAGIVHAAPSFPLEAQRAVAKSLLACFCLESVLYTKALVVDLKDSSDSYKIGFGSTGAIFLGLLGAFWGAILGPSLTIRGSLGGHLGEILLASSPARPPQTSPCGGRRLLEASLEVSRAPLGGLSDSFGSLLGASWQFPVRLVGHLGAVLGSSWASLGSPGPSWSHLGPSWSQLEPS